MTQNQPIIKRFWWANWYLIKEHSCILKKDLVVSVQWYYLNYWPLPVSVYHVIYAFRINQYSVVWLNGWVFVYELSGCGIESRCCHFTVHGFKSMHHLISTDCLVACKMLNLVWKTEINNLKVHSQAWDNCWQLKTL